MKRSEIAMMLAIASVSATIARPVGADEANRKDLGDPITLNLYGSYEEMGRQYVELMKPEVQAIYDFEIPGVERLKTGPAGQALIQYSEAFSDNSGLAEEYAGMAEVLNVPKESFILSLLGQAGGSTVFASTRSATADGHALIGRNVDWDDAFGRRRPVVTIYHPDGDDLEYMSVGWPLMNAPTAGLNEAGLGFSLNFFFARPQVGFDLPANITMRRVLQRAKNVNEAIEMITSAKSHFFAAYFVLADSGGEIALIELTPEKVAVLRPEADWFAHANHALIPEMVDVDMARQPDTYDRQTFMEDAVRENLGKLTPEVAAETLRNRRSELPFANEWNVANLHALNSLVIHPKTLTLWHSTTMIPHAPFGEYVPFTFAKDTAPPSIPASSLLTDGGLDLERREIGQVRKAQRLHHEQKYTQAQAAWDAAFAMDLKTLNVPRLMLGKALTSTRLGNLEQAYEELSESLNPDAESSVRLTALAFQAIVADELGQRAKAISLYKKTLALLEPHPDYSGFARIRATAEAGLASPQTLEQIPEIRVGV